jgi:hypothetical protein
MTLQEAPRIVSIRRTLALPIVLVALCVPAAPALAISGSSGDGNVAAAEYPDSTVQGRETLGGTAAGGGSGGDGDGGLPFGGFALATLAGIGLLAASGGLALRRATRPTIE